MPYASEKKRIMGTVHDGRRKLSEDTKDEIRNRYATGRGTQNSLAAEYGVSRSLIQIVVNPTRAEAVKKRVKEHWRDYHDQKAVTDAVRQTRRKKHALSKAGII